MARFEASPAYLPNGPHKLGILLVNSGTPDSLTAGGVRRFLRRLLRDRRTIETPRAIWCWILYLFILPLRPARVLPKYRRIWTAAGSPLLLHSQALRNALREQLTTGRGADVAVELGMLYSTPDVSQGLSALRAAGAQRIVVLPLFPQYSGTTQGAALDQTGVALRSWRQLPELHFLSDYATHEIYIDALARSVREHRAQSGEADHLLISFHGIPKKYIEAGDPYRSRCEATAQALAAKLQLPASQWTLSFQSRVGTAQWLGPYTDRMFAELAGRGVRRLDAICPGFAVDCLETVDEIGHEGEQLFRAAGGEVLRYIPALNAGPAQVALLTQLVSAY
jgi:protoporphyrin/coproporphyrin ferrochelatase